MCTIIIGLGVTIIGTAFLRLRAVEVLLATWESMLPRTGLVLELLLVEETWTVTIRDEGKHVQSNGGDESVSSLFQTH